MQGDSMWRRKLGAACTRMPVAPTAVWAEAGRHADCRFRTFKSQIQSPIR
ncbi:hypothetical protein Pcac1_g3402 [Phytophthora cactorum]|uniref:Uncharacterized protein n=1 Tax=Phytophthora cactorum TaxID=29920 RepID=A0A8T1C1D0_9STRA|nr:hypothetical protein Pcac1_g3402 [Phytophthora cactorum]KAG2885767.1 hypothetical protein PC114_g19541 [Phytophthora cactorum]KAG2911660.1 hypothetical protein PC117_g19095 [Phytophthora cactorum]KAG3140664.1 hypothetical protein C6341_g19957 [Phytophthora cactorum]KAG3163233.1 hypothetical protein PC128_g20445 [Phytophthora cactorum]